MNWLYITRAAAIAEGFTHEGTLFKVPVYVDLSDPEDPMVGAKVPALDLLLHVCMWSWSVLNDLGDSEHPFPLLLREKPLKELP